LLREVQNPPDWMGYAWRGLARHHAGQLQFGEAWELVRQYAPQPHSPLATDESLPDLERQFVKTRTTLRRLRFTGGNEASKLDDALNTLRHFTERPDSPAYFNFSAETWGAKGNWQRAWQSWLSTNSDSESQDAADRPSAGCAAVDPRIDTAPGYL
jgi:hypothetical protein